ncbi:Rha family transcriptional regulator [Bacillus cereus group sp. TH152-1LC]|uniref:Rha family transcriptional regulator n=1 Tax=Bacillus cereus group sp. TH152-1LC TaxID=3018060 RepID=UPI0022E35867|nr:Rha family transcriptional regulator [Bacillus cereus group sp. TH152-1LC]MDA1678919.1 ORF6C domain-containing protein [Bacillus cereus group sp. TH152-1LC]
MNELTVANDQMSNGLVFENNGEVVTDSLTIAEMFGKEHKNIKRDILETISKLASLQHSAEVNELGINFNTLKFEPIEYRDNRNRIQEKYILNFDAFMLVTMSYTTQKAILLKVKYINEFNRMKNHIKKQQQVPTDPMSILKLTFEALEGQKQELQHIKSDVKDLRENAPLFAVECDEVSNAVKRHGVALLGGKQSNAYQHAGIRGKVYRDIYNQLYREFGVTSHKAIKRGHLALATKIVGEYTLPIVLSETINVVNSQIKFSEM